MCFTLRVLFFHRDEVLSKNKYLEDEARRKAESVEREQNLSRSKAANAGATPEAQDDEIFYDSDAEKQPEEWVCSFKLNEISKFHILYHTSFVSICLTTHTTATASRAHRSNPSSSADQITKHIHHYAVSITTIASTPHK